MIIMLNEESSILHPKIGLKNEARGSRNKMIKLETLPRFLITCFYFLGSSINNTLCIKDLGLSLEKKQV
jgi:hypothetical protein